jgi:hypothetical protein
MTDENRLSDYLEHIRQAATDACSFVEGLAVVFLTCRFLLIVTYQK